MILSIPCLQSVWGGGVHRALCWVGATWNWGTKRKAENSTLRWVRITLILREIKRVCKGNRAHWALFCAKNVKQTKYGTVAPSADYRHVSHILRVSGCRRLAAPSCYAADRARKTGRPAKRTSMREFSLSQRAICDQPTVLAHNFLELLRRLTGSTCVQHQIFATGKWTVRSELHCFCTL
jgi:hypothetical protein